MLELRRCFLGPLAWLHVKYAVAKQIVKPYLVPTKYMSADVFTKAVDEETFFFCKHTLHNTEPDTYCKRRLRLPPKPPTHCSHTVSDVRDILIQYLATCDVLYSTAV